ncbi:MAG: DUF84 family protein [Clostridia bacterium]|nr:DUF84 family protein [Clostridia bacterium]
MKVLIGTKNPGKIKAAEQALANYYNDFEIAGVSVASDVAEQPINEETYQGAKNRALNLKNYAKQNSLDADMFLSVEAGMVNQYGKWFIVSYAVVMDKYGNESWGISPAFPVPNKFVQKIKETNLGVVMDEVFNATDLHSNKGGISLLTHDVISRIDITRDAFVMALTQYANDFWNDFERV